MKTRLFVSGPLINGAEIELGGDRARYLGRVLRARTGDDLCIFNGEGAEWDASIERMSKNTVTLRVAGRHVVDTESPLKIHLVQGVSRGERMDFVVQKATELGVKRISPVFTEHGVVKLDAKRAAKRQEHWQNVAASACEQCGRVRLPLIDEPVHLNKWFGMQPAASGTQYILAPGADTPLSVLPPPETKACILIGPEGGFSETEYENARIAGFHAVSLGPRVMRTETAATAALAVLQMLWGDLR